LFARAENKHDQELYSDSSDDEDDGYRIAPNSASCLSYKFPAKEILTNSAKVYTRKRKSSPSLKERGHQSAENPLNGIAQNRKVSRTSSSNHSSNGDFERDEDDSGMMTTSASKYQHSHLSSSDNVPNNNYEKFYKVSNFNSIIREEKEESSPLPQRTSQRKDSMTTDLDNLYQNFQLYHSGNLKLRTNSENKFEFKMPEVIESNHDCPSNE